MDPPGASGRGANQEWVRALPVGNGRLGAMVFGGRAAERIQFNESTVWSGAPHDYSHPGASEVLDTLLIHHAREHGADRIVMGDSRPCLANGVLRYKAKFGARIASTLLPQPVLSIAVRRWSPAVHECPACHQPQTKIGGRLPRPSSERPVSCARAPNARSA